MQNEVKNTDQLEKKARYLVVINRFALHLMNCQTVEDVYWSVAKDAIAELGYEDCVIYTYDEERTYLVQRAAHGPKNPIDLDILNPIKLKPGEGIVGHVALSGIGEIVNDTRKDPRYVLDDNQRLSEIAVPIIHNGQVIGVIDSEHESQGFYPEEDLEILTTIASMAASKMVQNQYFEELNAYKNELEGLVEQRTKRLHDTLREVESQRAIIAQKNQDLFDSLLYAKRIQQAVLPSRAYLDRVFESYFLYDQPKDVVSGDFFWVFEQEKSVLFAIADCTGHGVPGALLSLIGYNTLHQVVESNDALHTGEILDELRRRVSRILNEDLHDTINDGMDISLCRLDKQQGKLEFSGANHPLMIVRNKELIEIQGDRQFIGAEATAKPFTSHLTDVYPGDMIFLSSDGFKDQFGGPSLKKFKPGPFKELLRELAGMRNEERAIHAKNTFEHWKGAVEQTDDVCLFGLQLVANQ